MKEDKVIDFEKVEKIYLTNNKEYSEDRVREQFGNAVSEENLIILKDHLMEGLGGSVYSFFEYNGILILGLNQGEGTPVEFIGVQNGKK